MATTEKRPHVLIGVSGSVAGVKVPQLALELSEFADVKVVTTDAGRHMLGVAHGYNKDSATAFEAAIQVYGDKDEWETYHDVGKDPVLHIELRKWADVCLLAPLSANTMAKIASGICDNLLTCVLRAWDFAKPVIAAPAMNTHMWDHPFTAKHVAVLTAELHMTIVPPVSKTLACGDTGTGALAPVSECVGAVRAALRTL